jgi:hypothetical protein
MILCSIDEWTAACRGFGGVKCCWDYIELTRCSMGGSSVAGGGGELGHDDAAAQ